MRSRARLGVPSAPRTLCSLFATSCLAASLLAVLPAVGSRVGSAAEAQVRSPEQEFGFPSGADYEVADYGQMQAYFHHLADASERVALREIGRSVKGEPMLLLFISSEENIRDLERWRATSERLSRARISEDEARELARGGRAVVWIDGGMDDQEYAPRR